jgi:hypothetical protein
MKRSIDLIHSESKKDTAYVQALCMRSNLESEVIGARHKGHSLDVIITLCEQSGHKVM